MQFSDETEARKSSKMVPGHGHQDLLVMRTNVSSANYWAIAKGAGIGLLPTYGSAIGARVEPLDIDGMHRPFDIWLSYHPDAGRIPRVRKMIDWIVELFSAAQFPWFSDTFIHPNELSTLYKGRPLVKCSRGSPPRRDDAAQHGRREGTEHRQWSRLSLVGGAVVLDAEPHPSGSCGIRWPPLRAAGDGASWPAPFAEIATEDGSASAKKRSSVALSCDDSPRKMRSISSAPGS